MRGAVSAGMCLVLEAAGLMSSFDRVYGCSSGALTGCFAAAGQASLWATSFEDCASRAFIDPSRALRGRPCSISTSSSTRSSPGAGRSPRSGWRAAPSSARSRCRPRARSCGCCATSRAQRTSWPPLRASCSIPVLAGAPPTYRGEPTVDGGLLEPIPYRTALREGATHVLVLRSRDAGYRATQAGQARGADARSRPSRARAAAAQLQRALQPRRGRARAPAHTPGLPLVRQIAVPPGSRLVPRFSIDRSADRRQRAAGRVRDGVRPLRRARHALLAAVPRLLRLRRRSHRA